MLKHKLVVFLCSVYSAFSCSLHFVGSPPPSSPFFPFFFSVFFFFYIVVFIIYPVGSPLFLQFSVTGAGEGAGRGSFWQVGLFAGL